MPISAGVELKVGHSTCGIKKDLNVAAQCSDKFDKCTIMSLRDQHCTRIERDQLSFEKKTRGCYHATSTM